jgi:amidophosphoribosyltransferase
MRENFYKSDKIHDNCAVFGVSVDNKTAAAHTYNALLTMQHRGQEGVGISAALGKTIACKKRAGLVIESFADDWLNKMNVNMAVGHCLYSFAKAGEPKKNEKENGSGGSEYLDDLYAGNKEDSIQPSVTEYLTGRIAAAYNGNITNARELREDLMSYGLMFTGKSDGELISKLVAYYCLITEDVFEGTKKAAELLEGAFSLIIMSVGTEGSKLIAVRDAGAIRPLCIGSNGHGVAVASESCALDICGFDFMRDVKPGEAVMIEDGRITAAEVVLNRKAPKTGLCIFEYVYIARPDSYVDNLSVYEARVNLGRILSREHQIEADCVCGIPDSGVEAAIGYSLESGIPLIPGFMRNRYIGRTFIYPTQLERENAVKLKFNPLKFNVEGKRVILVDDSLVRGTSLIHIVRIMRNAGAKEIHLRIASPPIKYLCYYGGIDSDGEDSLIANYMTTDEICRRLGADSLGYISIGGLKQACEKCALPVCGQCITKDER